MKVIFSDGVLEATQYPEGWLYLRWLENKRGHLQKQLLRDLRLMEYYIIKNGLKGWFTNSDLEHETFHKLLDKVGAKQQMKDAAFIQFIKWIQKPEDLHHVRKCAKRSPVASIP